MVSYDVFISLIYTPSPEKKTSTLVAHCDIVIKQAKAIVIFYQKRK